MSDINSQFELLKEEEPDKLNNVLQRAMRELMQKKGFFPIYIIDLESEKYPDTYRICAEVTRHPNKNNLLYQNGKFYKIIRTLYLPSGTKFKEVLKPFMKKIPETGRAEYNFTFHKKHLDEVMKILTSLSV